MRKQAIIEKLISHRFFRRKQGLPRMAKHMEQQRHRILYAEDILRLNQGMCMVCAWILHGYCMVFAWILHGHAPRPRREPEPSPSS